MALKGEVRTGGSADDGEAQTFAFRSSGRRVFDSRERERQKEGVSEGFDVECKTGFTGKALGEMVVEHAPGRVSRFLFRAFLSLFDEQNAKREMGWDRSSLFIHSFYSFCLPPWTTIPMAVAETDGTPQTQHAVRRWMNFL